MQPKPQASFEDLKTFLNLLHPGGSTFQLAPIGVKNPKSKLWEGFASGSNSIVMGWFKDSKSAIEIIKTLDTDPKIMPRGIYISLNPVNPSLLSRCNHHLKAGIPATKNEDIQFLRNFMVDIDPIRPSETNSSEEEHASALAKAKEIRNSLKEKEWPDPIMVDTGNGSCLIYRLPDLPNDPANQELVKKCLKALAHQFDEERVKIDLSVANPAHLIRVPGTLNRKGDSTDDRPRRRAAIVSKPKRLSHVSFEKLKILESECPDENNTAPVRTESAIASSGCVDVAAYLKTYQRKIKETKKHGNSTLFVLQDCVFDPSHKGGEATIGLTSSGKLFYQCFHHSCQGRKWKEARRIISGDSSLTPFIVKSQAIAKQFSEREALQLPSESISLRTLTFNEVVQLPRENNHTLIKGVCYKKTPLLITGPTGIGKSELSKDLAYAFAGKGLFLREWQVEGIHRVLIIQSENSFRNIQDRIQRLPYDWSDRRQEVQERIFLLGNNGTCQISGSLVNRDGNPTSLATAIREKISDKKIDIVIFDPLSSFHSADENDNAKMRRVLDIISTYICTGPDVTPVVFHHHGKMDKERRGGSYLSRGASAVADWAGGHLTLRWANRNGRTGIIRAEWVKSRDFPSPGSIMLRRGPDGRLEKIGDEGNPAVPHQEVVRILTQMGGRSESKEALAKAIMNEKGVSRGTALKAIAETLRRGFLHMEGTRRGRASPIFLAEGS